MFTINTYFDSKTYSINVIDFYLDSLINFTINDESTTYQVEINFNAESISITGIGTFTFENYYGENGVTSTSGTIKNITAVFSAHYALNGNTSEYWSDNGDDDVYVQGKRKFMGKDTEKGPCNEISRLQSVTTTTYIFWIEVGSETVLSPC